MTPNSIKTADNVKITGLILNGRNLILNPVNSDNTALTKSVTLIAIKINFWLNKFLFPNIANKITNTPMKIYSYMDSGRPILATRITSHTQVLDAGNAFLVDPEPAGMAMGLTEVLSNSNTALQKAEQAKLKVATEYSRSAYEKKLTHFYDELTHVRNLRV